MTYLNLSSIKKNILASALLILPSLTLMAQTTSPAADPDILAIRTQCQQINTAKLVKHHFTYEADGCVEDGVVDYFMNGNEIVKVVESGAIGDGSWVEEYYYSGGKVIFSYEVLVGGPAIGKETRSEYRVYIKNGKALKTMEGKKTIPGGSKATEAIANAGKFYKAYTTKDFASALCGNN